MTSTLHYDNARIAQQLFNNEAKNLLINGFLLDVVEKITDEQIKKLVKNIIGLDQ